MKNAKKKSVKLKYIKDSKGNITQVYIDIDDYNSILTKLEEYEKLKKSLKK